MTFKLVCPYSLILIVLVANEADTCRKFVVPKLQAAGWDTEPHTIAEQRTFTDGRIVPLKDGRAKRRSPKRADYLLRYTRDFTLAVVEAKADYNSASDGLQQAKQYAEILGLNFAYSTNGAEIVEFDYLTAKETHLTGFPTPAQLWSRLRASQGIDEAVANRMLTPFHHASVRARATIKKSRSIASCRRSSRESHGC